MHQRRRHRGLTVALGVALLTSWGSAPAVAQSDEATPADPTSAIEYEAVAPPPEAPPTDTRVDAKSVRPITQSAYTLKKKEFQIGLILQAAGVANRVTLMTLLAGWILPAFSDVFAPNVAVRYRFLGVNRWSLSLGTSFAYIRVRDEQFIGDTEQDGKMFAIPLRFRTTHRARFGLLTSLEAVYSFANGNLRDKAVVDDFDGGVVTSGLGFSASLEYPVAKILALTLGGRVVAYVPKGDIEGGAVVNDYTTVSFSGRLTDKDSQGSFNVVAGLAFYWKIYHLRIGAGYGRYIFPEFGYVHIDNGPVFSLASYFRF